MAEPTDMDRGGGIDKLSLVVFSGTFEKVHYALVLASGTAAVGKPVTMLFTMQATRALLKAGEDGKPGWQGLPSEMESGKATDDGFKARMVGDFETLLDACNEMNVRFMVCEMGLRALDIDMSALRDDITIQPGGVVTFMHDASKDGSMLFI